MYAAEQAGKDLLQTVSAPGWIGRGRTVRRAASTGPLALRACLLVVLDEHVLKRGIVRLPKRGAVLSGEGSTGCLVLACHSRTLAYVHRASGLWTGGEQSRSAVCVCSGQLQGQAPASRHTAPFSSRYGFLQAWPEFERPEEP